MQASLGGEAHERAMLLQHSLQVWASRARKRDCCDYPNASTAIVRTLNRDYPYPFNRDPTAIIRTFKLRSSEPLIGVIRTLLTAITPSRSHHSGGFAPAASV